jgi:hypothetical protein
VEFKDCAICADVGQMTGANGRRRVLPWVATAASGGVGLLALLLLGSGWLEHEMT